LWRYYLAETAMPETLTSDIITIVMFVMILLWWHTVVSISATTRCIPLAVAQIGFAMAIIVLVAAYILTVGVRPITRVIGERNPRQWSMRTSGALVTT
jgi:hypothetical protein